MVYAIRVNRKENRLKRLLVRRLSPLAGSDRHDADSRRRRQFRPDRCARRSNEIVALGERDRYLPGLRSWVGFRQTGVEVERNARYDDHPRVSLRGLWRLAKTAIFSFSTLPLSIFYTIGYAALGLFLALTIACLYVRVVYRPGDSRLDFVHLERQLLRCAQCAGDQHARRVRDSHLRPGAQPAAVHRRSSGRAQAPADCPPLPWQCRRLGRGVSGAAGPVERFLDMVRGGKIDLSEDENSPELLRLVEAGAADER